MNRYQKEQVKEIVGSVITLLAMGVLAWMMFALPEPQDEVRPDVEIIDTEGSVK